MRILTINAGSSSIKLRLLDDDTLVADTDIAADADGYDTDHLATAIRDWPSPDAIGHRIVHGGTTFTGPVLIDPSVRQQLTALIDLAPLHQPKSLNALDAVSSHLPDVPAVACFDTAFHTTIPAAASTYAVPAEWRERYGIRRYGFHGLSHAYAVRRVAELVGRPLAGLRIVTCHLGAGASLAAVLDGRSVDTTMGFSPLEGLVMATRSGTIDPGIVPWLTEHAGISAHDIGVALETQSGMLALAGTPDMRQIEAAAAGGNKRANQALDIYIHHLAGGIATMTAATNGIDILVFTGGVGEHSHLVRTRTADRLRFLGIELDPERNMHATNETMISTDDASVLAYMIAAREDLQIAREVRSLLSVHNARE